MIDQEWVQIATLISAVAAAVAAGLAAYALHQNGRAIRQQSALEFLRKINEDLEGVWAVRGADVRAEALALCKGGKDLSPGGNSYMRVLASLDLLGLARENNAVSRKTVDTYLNTLLRGDTVDPEFIRNMQDAYRDENLYCHLLDWIATTRHDYAQK